MCMKMHAFGDNDSFWYTLINQVNGPINCQNNSVKSQHIR